MRSVQGCDRASLHTSLRAMAPVRAMCKNSPIPCPLTQGTNLHSVLWDQPYSMSALLLPIGQADR